jgi:hypothetical protein
MIYSAIVFVPPSYCEMDVLKEQRVCIKFCQTLGKTATETYEMLQQAFGETALSRSKIFEWHSRFKNGRTSIDDDPHTGRSSTARTNQTVDRVNAVIRRNRCLTIRKIADEINLSFGTCQAILTASQMVFQYLASAPRQCAMPRVPEWQVGQAQHPRGSPPTILTRFGPLRLLPHAEEHPVGEKISRRRGDTTKYDTAVAGHLQTSLPDMQ